MHGNQRLHSFLWKTEVSFFSTPQMSQAPSFSPHGQDMASPVWHLLALKQMLAKQLQLLLPVYTGRNMWEEMNEWLRANNEYRQLTLGSTISPFYLAVSPKLEDLNQREKEITHKAGQSWRGRVRIEGVSWEQVSHRGHVNDEFIANLINEEKRWVLKKWLYRATEKESQMQAISLTKALR